MRFIRLYAIIFSVLLIAGELYRSWGIGRPVAFVLDDVLMGLLLLLGGVVFKPRSLFKATLLGAGWAMITGMLYSSFFNKVFAPDKVISGNFDQTFLTYLVGVAFFGSLLGLMLTLNWALKSDIYEGIVQ